MPFAITGGRHATSSISSVGTTTVTVGTTPFAQSDYTKQRLVGLWSSDSVFKGMAWVRRWVSTSQLELEKQFFDPATGLTVTQVVGDQILVSKDFSESVVTGLSVSGRVVSITDTCTFGVNGNQMGVCFYDQNKLINATFGTLLSGGLVVFGKLDNYSTNTVSSSIDFQSTNVNPILCNNAAVNFCGYGGRWESSASPAYFIGGNNQGTAGNTVVLNGVETPNDLITNTAGGVWAINPTRHQLVNCYSITTATSAIMRRWGDGIVRGGQYKFPNNTTQPISVFGSDVAGTYNVVADPNNRAVISDMGGGAGTGKPSLVRTNINETAVVFNFTNIITTDFRSTFASLGGANNSGTNTFRFSDTYTNLQSGTVGVILNNSGAVADSTSSSNGSWSPSLLRRTCVGATVTVNATSWTYGLKKYGYQAISGTINPSVYDLGTAGSADNVAFGGVVNQLVDVGITLSNSAALALSSKFSAVPTSNGTLTVTGNATLDEVYDYLIAWGCSSVALAQFPNLSAYPATAAGTTLSTAMSMVVNSGVTLSAGTKFKTIATTGGLTLNAGGAVSGLQIVGNVFQATPSNLGSIVITGNLTYNQAADITVTLTNTTITGTVSNSGAGVVSISPAGSTSVGTAGANVTVLPVPYTVTFVGLPVGCDVVLLTAGTSTVLDQVDQIASTSYAYTYMGTPAIDVGFIKPGYVPFYIRNISLLASDSSIPVNLTADRNYL